MTIPIGCVRSSCVARFGMRMAIVFVGVLLTTGCAKLDRGIDVPPSVIIGNVLDDLGAAVPFAVVTRDGVSGGIRANDAAEFRLLVQSGTTLVRSTQDLNNDGVADLAAIRRVQVPTVVDRAAFVLLGPVQLAGTFELKGRVVDAGGAPVAGARAYVARRTNDVTELTTTGLVDPNNPLSAFEAAAITDANGDYTLTGLTRGDVQVFAIAPNPVPNEFDVSSTLQAVSITGPDVVASDLQVDVRPAVPVTLVIFPPVEEATVTLFRAGELGNSDATPVQGPINATALQVPPGAYDVVVESGTLRGALVGQVVPAGEASLVWSYIVLEDPNALPPFAGLCEIPEEPVAPVGTSVARDSCAVVQSCPAALSTDDLGTIADSDCNYVLGSLCVNAADVVNDEVGSLLMQRLVGVEGDFVVMNPDNTNEVVTLPELRTVGGVFGIDNTVVQVGGGVVTVGHFGARGVSAGLAPRGAPIVVVGDGRVAVAVEDDCVGSGYTSVVGICLATLPPDDEPDNDQQGIVGLFAGASLGVDAPLFTNGIVYVVGYDEDNHTSAVAAIDGQPQVVFVSRNAALQRLQLNLSGSLVAMIVEGNPVLSNVNLGPLGTCVGVVGGSDNPAWCQASQWSQRTSGFALSIFSNTFTNTGTNPECSPVCGDYLVQGDETCDDGDLVATPNDCDSECTTVTENFNFCGGVTAALPIGCLPLLLTLLKKRRRR
jgi:hypothetical protein